MTSVRVRETDLTPDAPSGAGVVPGDHDDADAGGVAFGDRGRHRRPHGIGQPHEAEDVEGEVVLRLRQILRAEAGPGHAEDAQPLVGHGRGLPGQVVLLVCREVAEVDDRFGSPLGRDLEGAAIRRAPDVGQRQELGRKGVFVHQRPVLVKVLGAGEEAVPEMAQRFLHGVERVALARQDPVFQQGVKCLREPRAGGAVRDEGFARGPQPAYRHLVHGQGAGLVGAEHGGGAERLHGRHAARQHAVLRDPPGAERQENGEDDRELLRERGHGHGDARQDPLSPNLGGVPPRQPVDHDHQGAEGEADDGKVPHEPPGLPLQRGALRRDALERLADLAEFRARPGREDLGHALPAGDERAGEDERQVVPAGLPDRLGLRGGGLADRDGLAGEEGLVGAEVHDGAERGVSRNAVALGEDDDVAADHLAPGDAPLPAVADHQRPRAGQVAQGIERPLGPALLDDGDAHHDEDEPQEQGRVHGFAHEQVE